MCESEITFLMVAVAASIKYVTGLHFFKSHNNEPQVCSHRPCHVWSRPTVTVSVCYQTVS